ncbi:carbonic anhydrase [Ectothiorhodospiraceae bacterium BW-2]|nr:carbonic anhydrase [Ectothiorhodospiraceae bacterium BW-2]
MDSNLTKDEALERLVSGNIRFVAGQYGIEQRVTIQQRVEMLYGQHPFAVILGCSDSRVPAEIIFDQGLGALFVIRIAGNIVAPSQIGSIEFALEKFQLPLVIVLGHSMCGAVKATIDEIDSCASNDASSVLSIVNRIRPVVMPLLKIGLTSGSEQLLETAIDANILASVNHLRYGSTIIEQRLKQGKLEVLGAKYHLDSGEVTFFNSC